MTQCCHSPFALGFSFFSSVSCQSPSPALPAPRRPELPRMPRWSMPASCFAPRRSSTATTISLGDPRLEDGAARREGLRPANQDAGSHRPRAARRRRSGRTVLVDLHPGRDQGQRLRARAARGVRHRPAHDRELSRPAGAGALHRRHPAGLQEEATGLAARHGRRPRHREFARHVALVLRARCAVHDPHPQRHARLGGRGARQRASWRADRVRQGSRARDEPDGNAGGPLARLSRHDERRARRGGGAGDLLTLGVARAGRSSEERARLHSRAIATKRRSGDGDLRARRLFPRTWPRGRTRARRPPSRSTRR